MPLIQLSIAFFSQYFSKYFHVIMLLIQQFIWLKFSKYLLYKLGLLVIFHGVMFSLHFHSLEGTYSLVRSLGDFWLFGALFARGRHFARGLLQFASFTRGATCIFGFIP